MTTSKPKVLATRHFPPDVEKRLAANFDALLNPQDRLYDGPALAKAAAGYAGIMCAAGDPLSAATIEALPDSVKMIATFSVGYEHVDVAAAAKRGIKVSNTPDVLTDATADIALLCLLGAARRAHEGTTMLRTHNWVGWEPTQLMGTHVTGKRLGILGMGRIGQAVADRARAFRMTIHYNNRSRLPADLEKGATFHANPDDMLPHCDFLSINAPLTPQTRKWVNAERIAKMPKGAVVVNTARGGVVDDEALIAALKSGRLAAAGIDVFDGEPKIHQGYYDLQNAFLLPHMGSATVETRNAMGFKALDNLEAFLLNGKTPPDLVKAS
ncbi:MAG: D-glycerate dehydrogenase [Proteobacteria bacterium]|nr:D-glycerate dehydrogenase [Pseudomonadota bacterium]